MGSWRASWPSPVAEMEVGVGIRGESGIRRSAIEPADAIADDLFDRMKDEVGMMPGARLAVLINGLGATPLEELYVLYARVARRITDAGATVVHNFIGEHATSLEMAGASISLLGLPERGGRRCREELLDTDELRDLDAALGDGDLGITVSLGVDAMAARVRVRWPWGTRCRRYSGQQRTKVSLARPPSKVPVHARGGRVVISPRLSSHRTMTASSTGAKPCTSTPTLNWRPRTANSL